MAKNILSEDKIKELAKSLNADEVSFVNYFKIFQALYDTANPTSFTNYFHKVSLFELENVNKIKNEDSFLKAIATFINEVTFNKKKIYFELSNEESIQKVLKVLRMLKTPKKYTYYIKKAKPKNMFDLPSLDIDFSKNKEIFEYIDNLEDTHFFNDFTKKVFDEQIDVAKIYYVDLDKIPLDKILNYCTKYPNRIKELYSFENKEYDKIQKICELNSESLIRTPNCRIDLYPTLKNIEIITVNSQPFPDPLPDNFNYESVKELETIFIEDDSEEKTNKALELINKCPNLEYVSFSTFGELTQQQLFNIFTKTTSKKIKEIKAVGQDLENDVDFTPIFKNLPKLSVFMIDCHCSMDFLFSLLPCISCERIAPSYPLLEQLLINYINEDDDNYILANFGCEFEGFYDYFKDKKEIMMRFERFSGRGCVNCEIPYVSELTVKKPKDIKNCIAKKIGTLNIMCPLNDDLKKFVEKTKPIFIKIKEGKLDEINSNETKIVYNLENEEITF
jgi:hypothetical protein